MSCEPLRPIEIYAQTCLGHSQLFHKLRPMMVMLNHPTWPTHPFCKHNGQVLVAPMLNQKLANQTKHQWSFLLHAYDKTIGVSYSMFEKITPTHQLTETLKYLTNYFQKEKEKFNRTKRVIKAGSFKVTTFRFYLRALILPTFTDLTSFYRCKFCTFTVEITNIVLTFMVVKL